ncbi:interleukin-15 receptor subunit alpha isoform X17 [Homo sapiens]|uniref:interleukin-15 receptor subunit alpha isoform X17 n=1 Tax=Homo sapiens TaxID=9606 RepID=UPI0005D01DFE|nr:interleukin-15 receptor subunit alpha isoform X17 [Homo sapiens]|eukprot:XP_011517774.1 interleukin-15 receptor subunit alpha isoform X13 [Homo sapiens]
MRLAGRQVPEQRSPPPPGLGSARPGSPAVSCGAAAMAPRRARGCRTLGLPALLLLLLLRPPATRGDPALVHQRPAPPSTVTTAGVTPQPESLSPSGKEPAASSPSSNNTAATTAAIVPGSQLMPSKSPSTGTTEISSHESSHGTPSQTTAKNWELTASASHQPPGVYPQGHSDTTVAISTSTVLLCGLSAVSLLACYLKSSSQRKVTYLRLSVNYKAPPGVGDVYREDTSVWAPPNDPVSSCAARTDREPEKVEEMLSPVNPLHRRIQEEENSSQRHFTYICIYTSLSVISTHYI